MKIKSTSFIQIDREYIISSRQLRKTLNIDGEIQNIGLYEGRSPNDIEKGVSAENDLWIINTREKQKSDV